MNSKEKLMYEVATDLRECLFELMLELSGSERPYPDMDRDGIVSAASGGMAFLRGLQRGTLTRDEIHKVYPCARYAD